MEQAAAAKLEESENTVAPRPNTLTGVDFMLQVGIGSNDQDGILNKKLNFECEGC